MQLIKKNFLRNQFQSRLNSRDYADSLVVEESSLEQNHLFFDIFDKKLNFVILKIKLKGLVN